MMASRSIKIQFTNFDTRPDHGKRRARSGGEAAQCQTQTIRIMWHSGSSCEVGTFPARAGTSVSVTSSTQHGHMGGVMPSKPLTRGPGSTWLRSEFSTAVRRTAASLQASFTFHKHRMHTPTWLMHGSRPQAAWPCACTRSPTLRSLGKGTASSALTQLKHTGKRGRL